AAHPLEPSSPSGDSGFSRQNPFDRQYCNDDEKMRSFDFIVIGSGIAGLSFALRAAETGSVAVVTKGRTEESNTARAQGGVACVVSAEDSFELHIADTLVA